MGNYELTVVLSGDATVAKKKATNKLIEKIVKTSDGKIGNAKDWGKINFAFPIRNEDSGIFLHYDLELNPKAAKNLAEKLRLEEDFLRHLLVIKEK